jgi:predicted transcriptional regulator
MTQKLSQHKISKMMALYFDGYSQPQIAEKLKINQATVSLSVGKFSAAVEQYGLEAAGKEYGIMNQVKELHSLAAEFKEAQLTAEEAQVGLKMVKVFQHFGVKAEDYQDLVQTCTKMKSEGYIDSAMKLNKLENSTGMMPEEIIVKATNASQQLKQTQAQL